MTANTTKECECLVAFIDILGFSKMMRSSNAQIRLQVIGLLEKLSNTYSSSHGVEVHHLGLGQQIFCNPEISTFSDNVVISIPLDSKEKEFPIYDSQHFISNVFSSIISIIWEGLHLGVLFRGAITKGRLYHNKNIVAGEALVHAVEIEKSADFPRIEIHPDVLNLTDSCGNKLIDDYIYSAAIKQADKKFYLNSLAWHVGVWKDYFHFHYQNQKWPSQEEQGKIISSAIKKIRFLIDEQILAFDGEPKRKWEWLKEEFDEAQKSWPKNT